MFGYNRKKTEHGWTKAIDKDNGRLAYIARLILDRVQGGVMSEMTREEEYRRY